MSQRSKRITTQQIHDLQASQAANLNKGMERQDEIIERKVASRLAERKNGASAERGKNLKHAP